MCLIIVICILTTPKALARSAKTETRSSARTEARGATDIICSANIYNCSDFSTSAKAQEVYEFCRKKTGKDVHDLDRDKDGLACEK